jgi:hypothetical protein
MYCDNKPIPRKQKAAPAQVEFCVLCVIFLGYQLGLIPAIATSHLVMGHAYVTHATCVGN